MANLAHHFMGFSHSSIFAILIVVSANNDSVRDATIRNILPLLLFKIWWNPYEDYISRFKPSLSYWLTENKTNKTVGLFLQKSFLNVENWVSSCLCSGTHLLTQRLNSELAHSRYVAVLEKLFSFVPLLSCFKPKGALAQSQLQSEGSLLSPLCWRSNAGGPEPMHNCLWGEQGWQPALDKPVVGHRGGISKRSTPAWAPHPDGWARAGVWWGKLVPQTADGLSALHCWSPTCFVVPLLASMTNAAITCQDLSALWTDSWQCEFLSLKSFCAGILQAIYWNLFFCLGAYHVCFA